MSEKLNNIFKRYNVLTFVAMIVMLINSFLLMIFKNTAIKPTFSCRFLVLISAFIALASVMIEFYNVIYQFIKSKNKVKFIVSLILLLATFALILWAIIKYFNDFEIYYVDNNKTNIILTVAFALNIAYMAFENFERIKEKYCDFILPALFGIISIIMMITLLEDTNITRFYVFNISSFTSMSLLFASLKCDLFKKSTFLAFYIIAGCLALATSIITQIDRTSTDIVTTAYFIMMAGATIMANVLASGFHSKNIFYLVCKTIAMIFAIAVFTKIVYSDATLKDFDLSRILFILTIIPLAFSCVKDFKSLVSIVYLSILGAIALTYIILAPVIYAQSLYELTLYKVFIAFIVLFGVMALIYAVLRVALKRREKSQELNIQN